MAFKDNRELTVCRSRRSKYNCEPFPSIMLDGKWLGKIGFKPGDKVALRCEEGKLTIENTGRKWDS